jgi:dTMP kinase
MHLLFSANRWELSSEIEAKLNAGITIILDRYIASGLAFSMAKGLGMDWSLAADKGLPSPDITFYLKMDPDHASTRGGYGAERYERLEFQRKVSTAYQTQVHCHHPPWVNIDASNSIEAIHKEILKHIQSLPVLGPVRHFSQ